MGVNPNIVLTYSTKYNMHVKMHKNKKNYNSNIVILGKINKIMY